MTTELRKMDLTAKLAGVTLKDTIRVVLALRLVAENANVWMDDVLDTEMEKLTATRPSQENAAACEQAYFALWEAIKVDPQLKKLYKRISNFK